MKYLATFSSPLRSYYIAVLKLSRYSDTGRPDFLIVHRQSHTKFQLLQPTEMKLLDSGEYILREGVEQPVSGTNALSLFFLCRHALVPHGISPKETLSAEPPDKDWSCSNNCCMENNTEQIST